MCSGLSSLLFYHFFSLASSGTWSVNIRKTEYNVAIKSSLYLLKNDPFGRLLDLFVLPDTSYDSLKKYLSRANFH